VSVFDADKMTVGEFVSAVCSIHDKEEALAFVESYRAYLIAHPPENGADPADLIMFNIGWCFGEGMRPQDRLMWHGVCGARHPVFGMETPSFKDALMTGVSMGQAIKDGVEVNEAIKAQARNFTE